MLLSIEEFDSLEVGDNVETRPVLPALTDDVLVLRTSASEPTRKEFIATYCGITLGRWVCEKNDRGLKWTT